MENKDRVARAGTQRKRTKVKISGGFKAKSKIGYMMGDG